MDAKFKPPASIAKIAQKAIDWKQEHGEEVDGGTQVGWTRAGQLARREELSFDIIKRMHSFFSRHAGNQTVKPELKDTPWKDNGLIAWMIWGGDPAKKWVEEIIKKHSKDENMKTLVESALEGIEEKKQRTLVQYNSNSNVYRPTITTKGEMEAGVYEIKANMQGVFFEKKEIKSDELLKFNDKRNTAIMDEVANFRKMKDDFAKIGMNHKRGMILHGRPGTGKSCLIKLMTEQCVEEGDIVFICDRPGLILEGLKAFKEVEPERTAMVIMEEIDEILRYGGRTMSELLDGQDQVSNILYIATTNHIERIHPKFLREGRFDSKIEIGTPPKEGRLAFLKGKLGINEKEDIMEEIADNTDGFTFAQLREYLISVYCYKRDPEKVIARIKKGSGMDESLDYTDEQIAESVFYYYYAQDSTREDSQGSNRIRAIRDTESFVSKAVKGL